MTRAQAFARRDDARAPEKWVEQPGRRAREGGHARYQVSRMRWQMERAHRAGRRPRCRGRQAPREQDKHRRTAEREHDKHKLRAR